MPWQLVTYGFLHASQPAPHRLQHVRIVDVRPGSRAHDGSAAVPDLLRDLRRRCGHRAAHRREFAGRLYPTLGASGGVFGILLAYGMAFPNRTMMLLFPPIPMKAKYFVSAYGLLELYLGVSGARLASRISHISAACCSVSCCFITGAAKGGHNGGSSRARAFCDTDRGLGGNHFPCGDVSGLILVYRADLAGRAAGEPTRKRGDPRWNLGAGTFWVAWPPAPRY